MVLVNIYIRKEEEYGQLQKVDQHRNRFYS